MFHRQSGHLGQLDHFRKIFIFFTNGQVALNNQTTSNKSLYFSPTGRPSMRIRSLPKNLCIFQQQAGRLEQLDHFRKIFKFFTNGQVAWNNQTTNEKNLYFSPTGRSPETITSLSKNHRIFHQWAGHLRQLDHF